jgi:hypothetical protein
LTACRIFRERGFELKGWDIAQGIENKHTENPFVLVACCGSKLKETAPTADLYISYLAKRREWGRKVQDQMETAGMVGLRLVALAGEDNSTFR